MHTNNVDHKKEYIRLCCEKANKSQKNNISYYKWMRAERLPS